MASRFWRRKRADEPAVSTKPATDTELDGPSPRAARWRRGLSRLRDVFRRPFEIAATAQQSSEELFDELEEVLIRADVGVETAVDVVDRLRTRMKMVPRAGRREVEVLRDELRQEFRNVLGRDSPDNRRLEPAPHDQRPYVVLVVGVNGVGKTTSVAKLAARHKRSGKKVLLVAGDTFRAAAVEQLSIWAERLSLDIVKHQHGASPTAVVFDGLRAAAARSTDIVVIDTAGRLHTKTPLMEELKKMYRVIGREIPGGPHEVLLVLDAGTGQNALSQARSFQDALPLSGVILSKMDGSAKGGVALAVGRQLGVPIQYIGLGERADDLEEFSADEFIAALFDTAESENSLDAANERQ